MAESRYPLVAKKHQDIKAEYSRLCSEGFRHQFIAEKLAKKYYMSANSIANIVWESGGYAKPKPEEDDSQLNLF